MEILLEIFRIRKMIGGISTSKVIWIEIVEVHSEFWSFERSSLEKIIIHLELLKLLDPWNILRSLQISVVWGYIIYLIRRRHTVASLHRRKFRFYGVPREMNVGFSLHYVKYAFPPLCHIAREREPIASFLKNVTQSWSWCLFAPVWQQRTVSSYLGQIF